MSDLAGKSVLITGASRGIGEATARHFAAQGAKVMLAARSLKEINRIAAEINAAGGTAQAKSCDVSWHHDVASAVQATVEAFGSLDILINNAGLIDPITRITDADPEDWALVIDVNLKGVFYGYHAAMPVMQKQGGGTIINISSGAATGALEGWSHYCASKAGVLSLTKCGHKEMAEHGIRVMGLSPGTVATEMQVEIKASGINPVSQLDPGVHIPADWVAKGLAYLCGP
ncbi:MAG: SDR family NAD(P)-dependent oxidoreductase, partial [Litoreibacter sp.]|nr:SDR family NAD(P)-dependent oxidoreductase [Litoreibacter sp.]